MREFIVLIVFIAGVPAYAFFLEWITSVNLPQRKVRRHKANRRPSLFGWSKPRRRKGQPANEWFTPYQRHQSIRDIIDSLARRTDALMADYLTESNPLAQAAQDASTEPVTISYRKIAAGGIVSREQAENGWLV